MVSVRCRLFVRDLLEKYEVPFASLELGVAELLGPLSTLQQQQLSLGLQEGGFEILLDAREILVEKIKVAIIEMVHVHTDLPHSNFSHYLAGKLHHDYTYLANVFSQVRGNSIERYIILNRIERIKELLEYNEMTLKVIAEQLRYSSVSHLCNQFKKITRLTTQQYQEMETKVRRQLEDL